MGLLLAKNKITSKSIQADFYKKYYNKIFCSEDTSNFSFTDIAYKITHIKLEKKIPNKKSESLILEIGAGQGEHLKFVKHSYREYIMVDKYKPDNFRFKNRKVRYIESDIKKCKFPKNNFDRIIITCVLHHLDDPFLVLSKIRDWLKPGGTISIFLPCDPGFAVRLNRFLFVNRKAKKVGFSKYNLLNALEHKNHVWGIEIILFEIYESYKIRRTFYPFLFRSNNLNLFSIWQITKKID